MELTPDNARKLAQELRAKAEVAEKSAKRAKTEKDALALLSKARVYLAAAARWEAVAARMEAIDAASGGTGGGAEGDPQGRPRGDPRPLRRVV